VSRTITPAPGLWDALRGAGGRRELDELLDLPCADPRELAGNLRHLRLLNRTLGWSAAVWRDLDALMRRSGLTTATVLDIATGSADIPRDLVRRAAVRGRHVTAIASDVSAQVLAQAREHGTPAVAPVRHDGSRAIALVQHDGAMLPFRDGAVDIGLCCLAAHHFAPHTLTRVLAELWRVARHGVIVSDLTRGRIDYLLARLMALALRNRLTSHDGPVSVLRAYTPHELWGLARTAGLERVRVRTAFPARMTLVAEKGLRV
jgi:ubiquinone/menaquinone biosynthesis C-methylase UbiE